MGVLYLAIRCGHQSGILWFQMKIYPQARGMEIWAVQNFRRRR